MNRDYSINIVIPMAGNGVRFAQAGYELPKPFIDMWGEPMIDRVLENLSCKGARYILIARSEHVQRHAEIVARLKQRYPIKIHLIDRLTEGSAATVLFARSDFADEKPMLIANCDQIIDGGVEKMVQDCAARSLDGSIMVFEDSDRDPKWSFVSLDHQNLVKEAREKQPISEWATVGAYLFSRGSDFREAALEMILRGDRVNGEFYSCPVYNYLVEWGRKIGVYTIERTAMHGIGTPDDLVAYMRSKNGDN